MSSSHSVIWWRVKDCVQALDVRSRGVRVWLSTALMATVVCAHEPVLAQGSASSGDTVIDIAFDESDYRVRPDPAPGFVHHTHRLVLKQGNAVFESNNAAAANGHSVSGSSQGILGAEMSHGDRINKLVWHVAGANKLINVRDYPQDVMTMVVTVLPNKTCTLTVDVRLKPGYTEYKRFSINKQVMAYYSSWTPSNPTCQIH